MKDLTKQQLQQDVEFLANRALRCQSVYRTTFDYSTRDTGLSSNSIVLIAYGQINLERQYMPSDLFDMQACERMWEKLPEHRKTGNAIKAMEAARNCNYYGKVL